MNLFDWRSPAMDGRRQERERGAIRAQQDSGLAPSPTAPFGDLQDAAGRPALPSLGAQDAFVLDVAVERLRQRDPGFDPQALARLAGEAMVAVERAWSTLDPQPSRAFMAPSLWASHRARMELYSLHGRRNVVDEVHVQSSRLVALEEDAGRDRATLRIRASSTDYDVDASGTVLRGDRLARTWEADWVLERSSSATSRDDGGVLGGHCPYCGAPLQLDGDGLCGYCHAAATDATHDWVVVYVADVGREDDVMRAVLGIRTHVRLDEYDLSPADEVVSLKLPVGSLAPVAGGDDVLAALRLRDPNADATEITVAARTAFVALRTAWGAMDAARALPVMTAGGVAALSAAITALRTAGLRCTTDDPLVEEATLLAAEPGDEWQSATVRVVASTVDADLDATGAVSRGSLQPRRLGCDMPLRRRVHRAGEVARCPRCGAPLRASVTGVCDFCRQAVAGGGGDWLLDSVPELAETRAPETQAAADVEAPGHTAAASPEAAPATGRPAPLAVLRAHDAAVNEAEILARARECFFTVESALGRGSADAAATCVSPAFLAGLRQGIGTLAAAHRHRVLAFIDVEGARLVSASVEGSYDRAVVRIDVSGEDCVVDDATGAVVAGSTAQRRWSEDWTLLRTGPGQPWLVDAVAGPPPS